MGDIFPQTGMWVLAVTLHHNDTNNQVLWNQNENVWPLCTPGCVSVKEMCAWQIKNHFKLQILASDWENFKYIACGEYRDACV